MKQTKLWITPVTKEVEIVEVSNGVIGKRTKVDPVEALACGVMALYNKGAGRLITFTDSDDFEWEVKFVRKEK